MHIYYFQSPQNHFDRCKRKPLKCPNVCGSFIARNKVGTFVKSDFVHNFGLILQVEKGSVFMIMSCSSEIFLDGVSR